MTPFAWLRPLTAAMAAAAIVSTGALPGARAPQARPVSFHNRLLLNRAALIGLQRIELMLISKPGDAARAAAVIAEAGGRVTYAVDEIGYLRAEVPIGRVVALGSDPSVQGWQISTLSRAAWYRDTPPRINADMFREYEMAPPGGTGPLPPPLPLPALPPSRAGDSGFTGDDGTGLKEWFARHPAFDGRGVTIALLETAQPELSHPTIGQALTLDGKPVAKLAGILNTIDPDEPDDTRVRLDTHISAKSTWTIVGDRTYVLPSGGEFAFGIFTLPAGRNLAHQFGVLRDVRTGEIRIDANGNADFRDEKAIAEVNDRFDVRMLTLTHPRPTSLPFVVGKGRTADVVHVYVSRSDHQAMTLSVAAGSRTADGLAYGVAPGARVLLVRNNTAAYRVRDIIEGYIEAARVPEVDVIASATGFDLVPDTGSDFAGLLMNRIIHTYGKPIFQSAGNRHLWLNSAVSLGDVFSVGGSIGPSGYDAFYGSGALEDVIVHPSSAGGPAIDGAVKPDIIAPMHRIAASLWGRTGVAIPKNAPTHQLPPGYQISCCTSASAPYAAGAGALLISGLKQQGLKYSFDTFSRALRAGSRILSGFPAHQQGNGVLDVNGAWRELTSGVEAPIVLASAPIVHPLARYSAGASRGVGLFESEGWRAGMTGRRTIRLRRESGSTAAVTYRVSLDANDGTFAAPPSVTLPLGTAVSVPIDIDARSTGLHDALLTLHDPETDAMIFRTGLTIIAAERLGVDSHVLRLEGRVPLLRKRAHYIEVPAGVGAMTVDLEVRSGAAGVNIVPQHSLFLAYQGQIGPQNGRTFPKGRYSIVIPQPGPGTWTIDVNNTSTRRERDQVLVSEDLVDYVITVTAKTAGITVSAPRDSIFMLDISNAGAALARPAVQFSAATIRTHSGVSSADGLPYLVDIDIPPATSTLLLKAAASNRSSALELHLYDCTSGECFSHNYTIPAAANQQLVVRNPAPGRWIAAINTAPSPSAHVPFVLGEVVAGPAHRQSIPAGPSRPNGGWTARIDAGVLAANRKELPGAILFEVLDESDERREREQRWEIRDIFPGLPNAPVAAGVAVWRAR
jgi:hypothetical protein